MKNKKKFFLLWLIFIFCPIIVLANENLTVSSISTENYINKTLNDYKKDIENFQAEIGELPQWIKDEIEENIDLTDIKREIDIQEKRFENITSEKQKSEILEKLIALKVPYKIKISEIIKSEDFFINKEQVDLDVLADLGAGDISGNRDAYPMSMENWVRNNLKFNLESKTYSAYLKNTNENELLISLIRIDLESAGDTGKFFLVINGDSEGIVFKNDIENTINFNSIGVEFSGLNKAETIEFLYPESINILKPPFYISPEFKSLEIGDLVICNDNGICEKESGENYKNCAVDCKPTFFSLSLIFILLAIGFVVYIILQEWYKRRYESSLFKNRNELFNLISFINNSLNQGLKKSEIFIKLKNSGWNNEPINYSWNKFHGKRTGMWEIPIFKLLENRKIKKEIEKRKMKFYDYRNINK